MKRNFHGCLLLLSLLCVAMAAPALAEGPAVQVGVSVSAEGTMPEPAEEITVRMWPDAPGNPMPEGEAEVRIPGEGSALLPKISFDRVGVYRYTIRQLPGVVAGGVYDGRAYHLTVYVTNAEDGDGLAVTSVLYADDEAGKQAVAAFVNTYPAVVPEETPTPVPTPQPENGGVTPTGVADDWPFHLAGAAVLLVIGGALVVLLRRREDR